MCRKQKNLLLCIVMKGWILSHGFQPFGNFYQIECTSQGSKNESDTMLEFVSGAAKGHSHGCNFDLSFAIKLSKENCCLEEPPASITTWSMILKVCSLKRNHFSQELNFKWSHFSYNSLYLQGGFY